MTDTFNPLILAIMHHDGLDVDDLLKGIGPTDRPLAIRKVAYRDLTDVRRDKAAGVAIEQLRRQEQRLTEEQRFELSGAEVMLALDLPVDILEIAPNLRWVQAYGAGIGQLVRVLTPARVPLTSAAGVAAPGIAEFVIARILQVYKRLRTLDDQQEGRIWHKQRGRYLRGRTLGLVGLGAIGTETARLANAMGMKVIAVRRQVGSNEQPATVDEVRGAEDLDWLLASAEVVVLAAAETAETLNLIGNREIGIMRDGAILCNVARGTLLDEKALANAIRSGHLGAAILDVTRDEPLSRQSPLWSLPEVYLSPHTSVPLDGYDDRLMELFADNLQRFLRGAELRNRVRYDRGY
jgi:phosphoglycerate dehydrogenase-like enzyme